MSFDMDRLGRLDKCMMTCLAGRHGNPRYNSITTPTGHAHHTKQALLYSTMEERIGSEALSFFGVWCLVFASEIAVNEMSYTYIKLRFIPVN